MAGWGCDGLGRRGDGGAPGGGRAGCGGRGGWLGGARPAEAPGGRGRPGGRRNGGRRAGWRFGGAAGGGWRLGGARPAEAPGGRRTGGGRPGGRRNGGRRAGWQFGGAADWGRRLGEGATRRVQRLDGCAATTAVAHPAGGAPAGAARFAVGQRTGGGSDRGAATQRGRGKPAKGRGDLATGTATCAGGADDSSGECGDPAEARQHGNRPGPTRRGRGDSAGARQLGGAAARFARVQRLGGSTARPSGAASRREHGDPAGQGLGGGGGIAEGAATGDRPRRDNPARERRPGERPGDASGCAAIRRRRTTAASGGGRATPGARRLGGGAATQRSATTRRPDAPTPRRPDDENDERASGPEIRPNCGAPARGPEAR